MNIAQQAHQDGQEFRKANGAQGAGEALENRARGVFTHTGLDFQHWQLYRDNRISGFQSIENGPEEQALTNTAYDTIYTLVPSTNRGRYALDDPEHGQNIASGDALAILLAGQWIEGSIVHAANLYVIAYGSRLVTSGYYFIARDGGMCGYESASSKECRSAPGVKSRRCTLSLTLHLGYTLCI